jgi:hypothetical protein
MAATERTRPGGRAFHGRSGDDLCPRGIQPKPDCRHRFRQPLTIQRYGDPNSSPYLADSDCDAGCYPKSSSCSDDDGVTQTVRRLLDVPGTRRDHDRAPG